MFATRPLAPGNKISTLDELERPLGKHGHDPGIKRGTDLIDDGVQGTANHLDVTQYVRTCSSTDCKSQYQVGCRVPSVPTSVRHFAP